MLRELENRVRSQGLLVRSIFRVTPEDRVPVLADGQPAVTLILVGNAGSAMWQYFRRSPEYADGRPDPLDRWSQRLAGQLAEEFGGEALYPFGGPPFHPFLSWARRGDPSVASPLGLSLDPRYGLWHAYRFALSLPQSLTETLEVAAPGQRPDPCGDCESRGCLSACPVGAFSGQRYDSRSCARFLAAHPDHPCNKLGCRARRACPAGRSYQYEPDHARFHMRAFVENHCPPDSH